jgi:hypothetical protein
MGGQTILRLVSNEQQWTTVGRQLNAAECRTEIMEHEVAWKLIHATVRLSDVLP